jgi:hypothetical protein
MLLVHDIEDNVIYFLEIAFFFFFLNWKVKNIYNFTPTILLLCTVFLVKRR